MAFKAVRYGRWMMVNENENRLLRSFVSSTTPKMATAADAMNHDAQHHHPKASRGGDNGKKLKVTELLPLFGMTAVAVVIGVHTAYQQLVHSPGVKLAKKKRESLPEVDHPDDIIGSADKFVNKSFLRKVAHIQHDDQRVLPDTSRPNPFTRSRDVETLKSVGVEPHRSI